MQGVPRMRLFDVEVCRQVGSEGDELDHVHVAQPAGRKDATRVHVCGERIVEEELQPVEGRLMSSPGVGRMVIPSPRHGGTTSAGPPAAQARLQ